MRYYFDTYQEFHDQIMMENIEMEMQQRKKKALERISLIVHSNKSEDFALMMASCFFEQMPQAENIADELELSKIDFLAIMEDYKSFKEEYLLEEEEKYVDAIGNY